MWWPFRKKKIKPEPESIVQERWMTNFTGAESRFRVEKDENYQSDYVRNGFRLTLHRQNLFAWALFLPYRYRNMVLSAKIVPSPDNGHASAGVVFRYADEQTYYYALINPAGVFRFDVVFNGMPRTLIPWTEYTMKDNREILLTVVSHGTFFAIFINDQWVAEVGDETIDAGFAGFAAQNYGEKDSAVFILQSFTIESHDSEVEDFYDTRIKGGDIPPANRKNLARRFFDTGQYRAALVQLKKAFSNSKPGPEDFLLEAQICNFLNLEADALAAINHCFPAENNNREIVLEKAGILYRMNNFLELKEYLTSTRKVWEREPIGWNLLGNAEDALGNFDKSYEYYQKAVELDGSSGVYFYNAARVCEKKGDREEAFDLFYRAASCFFQEENYQDLRVTLSHLKELSPDNPAISAFEGKLLFQDGRIDEAFIIFNTLREAGNADSSINFLYALILAGRGKRREADEVLKNVVKEEPEYYLYWFRYAENLYFLGKDGSAALEKALEYNNSDPWVMNLAGLIALDEGNTKKALSWFEQAFEKDPTLIEVRINYSETLMKLGRAAEAFALVKDDEGAEIINQRGNLQVKAGQYNEAVGTYLRAVKLSPENRTYRKNYADLLLKLDRILEAEEVFARLLEEKPESTLLVQIARIADMKGEFRRAEIAYQEALKHDSSDDFVIMAYVSFLISRNQYKKAQTLLEKVSDAYDPEKKKRMNDEIRQATMERYECSICHREWWVPNDIPEMGVLKLHGEPHPESPAGKCPSCGKVYCVACAHNTIRDNRFVCADCDIPLKLSENYLRYLAAGYAKDS